jgi:homoserine dehydrogenase
MNVGLLGFGTVGKGVATIIDELDGPLKLVRFLSLPGTFEDARGTSNYQDFLADKSIEVVVEAMGGIEPARTYILDALNAGKSVVTANKAVVAACLEEFAAAAAASGATLLVEATSGGGIPWIVNLERVKRIDAISEISGILNGTSNYIIDRMHKAGLTFEAALKEAQDLGYAERDPSADIDGIDVKNKTIISSTVAFDSLCRSDIPVVGIRNLSKEFMDAVHELGYGVRLMAHAVACEGAYAACVMPTLLPIESVEANVPDNFNIATCVGTTVGPLKFYGQGAGSLPTGNAIVQDLLDLEAGKKQTFALEEHLTWAPELLTRNYLVSTVAALPQDGKKKGAGLVELEGLTAVDAAALYEELLVQDPHAFIAAIEG